MKNKNKFSTKILSLLTLLVVGFGAMSFTKANIVYASVAEEHNHTGWTGVTELPTEAGDYNIYLTDNITLSETWTVPVGETNLCLNGHVINAICTNENKFRAILIKEGATLNLYDCDTTTSHNGYVDSTGLWHFDATGTHILEANETEKDIIGGIITGGNDNLGGGIYVVNGTFNMFGGTIAGNVGKNGGGVNIYNAAFTMRGGNILGNTASVNSAGVHSSSSRFEMTGGIITENVTNSNDANALTGGVYISNQKSNVIFGGSAKIINNSMSNGIDDRYAANLGLYKTATVSLGTGIGEGKNGVILPNDDMSIGVTMKENTGKFATGVTAKDIKYFSSDNEDYEVLFNSGTKEIGDEYLELKEKATIADILPAHFPTRTGTNPVPENAWVNENGAKLYVFSAATTKLSFDGSGISAGGFLLDVGTTVTASDGNYTCPGFNGNGTVTFKMSNGKLSSVVVTGYELKGVLNEINGEYKGTIVHTLTDTHDKVEPTCLTAGHEAYYECDCGAFFSDLSLTQEIQDIDIWLAEGGGGYIAPQHNFGGTVTYTWEGDQCTASWKCNHAGCNEVQTETVTGVYVKDSDATTESNEKGHYEATFSLPEFGTNSTAPNTIEKPNTKLASGLSGGAIAGISIGSTLILIIIAYISMFFYWKKKDKAIKFLIPSYEWINKTIFKK